MGEVRYLGRIPPDAPRPKNPEVVDGEPNWAAIRARHRKIVDTLSQLALSTEQMQTIADNAEADIGLANSVMLDIGGDASAWRADSVA